MASVSDLAQKYRDFNVPTIKITVDGTELSLKDLTVKHLEVQLSTGYEASYCSFDVFEIYDWDQRCFIDKHLKTLALGKTVEIYMGYIETTLVFKGYIEVVKAVFEEESFPHLVVECLDVKGQLMHGFKSVVYNLSTYNAIVSQVLDSYGSLASEKTVDTTTSLKREVQQHNESDYTFICRLARSIYFEFFVLAGKVYFRKPAHSSTSPTVTLEWGSVLLSFEQERNLSKYVSKVTVKGYDDKEHKVISSTASSSTAVGTGSKKAESFLSSLASSEMVLSDYEINTVDEAKVRAEAELNYRSMAFITARGKCVGLPEIVPGKFLEIKSLDASVDLKYYVTKVVHRFDEGDYRTQFEAGANRL